MNKFMFLILMAASIAKADTNKLIYIGSCTWGPQSPSLTNCTHLANNALTSIFVNPVNKNVYVFNRVTKTDVNFCTSPEKLPDLSALTLASAGEANGGGSISWLDPGAKKESGLTLLWNTINEGQASTNSFNFKQISTGNPMTIYAPCFLVKDLNEAKESSPSPSNASLTWPDHWIVAWSCTLKSGEEEDSASFGYGSTGITPSNPIVMETRNFKAAISMRHGGPDFISTTIFTDKISGNTIELKNDTGRPAHSWQSGNQSVSLLCNVDA